jgi:hypothetical protein
LLTNNGSKFARPVEPTKRIRAEIWKRYMNRL